MYDILFKCDPRAETVRWYAAMMKPQQDRKAQFHLNKQGYLTICPYEFRQIHQTRRTITLRKPVFGRYLFVGVPGNLSVYTVDNTFGMSGVIKHGPTPLSIPAGVVIDIYDRMDENGIWAVPCEPENKRHNIGDRVQVLAGPLAGFLAEISKVDDSQEIQIFIDLFGRRTPGRVPISAVSAPVRESSAGAVAVTG